MKFIYAPEGAAPRSWEFAPGRMSSTEAIDVERLSGMRFSVWRDEVTGGSILATKALLFVLLRHDVPSLSWTELDFRPDECAFTWDDDEQLRIIAGLEERARVRPLSEAEAAYLHTLKAAHPDPEPAVDADTAAAGEGDASDPTQPPSAPEPQPPIAPGRSGSA